MNIKSKLKLEVVSKLKREEKREHVEKEIQGKIPSQTR
jgi:hypothetical protein